MAKLPSLPPIRCHCRVDGSSRAWCARPATHLRLNVNSGIRFPVCKAHAREADEPLRAPIVIPTVMIACEIAFAGVSRENDEAVNEALQALELAVRGAAATVSVRLVTVALGRYYPLGAGGGRPPGPPE